MYYYVVAITSSSLLHPGIPFFLLSGLFAASSPIFAAFFPLPSVETHAAGSPFKVNLPGLAKLA